MHIVEKKYRDTPQNNRKYVKRLSDYINILLENGRVLEAKYHFSELLALKPDNVKTHVIGYKIAIKTFDSKQVGELDKLLVAQKYKEQSLHCLRLQYYYSVNNQKCFRELVIYMLANPPLSETSLDLIAPLVLQQRDYRAIQTLCNYLKSINKHLNKAAENKVRKVVLQRLVDSLVEVSS